MTRAQPRKAVGIGTADIARTTKAADVLAEEDERRNVDHSGHPRLCVDCAGLNPKDRTTHIVEPKNCDRRFSHAG